MSNRRTRLIADIEFTVVNLRGDGATAMTTVKDLRASFDGRYYVSDPYELSGALVFALCPVCTGDTNR